MYYPAQATTRLVVLVFVGLLAGCASRAAKVVEEPQAEVKHPPVKSIALVTVSDPPKYFATNAGGLLPMLGLVGGAIQMADRDSKSSRLTDVLSQSNVKLGQEMTAALREELAKAGYEVTIISAVKRPADDPEGVDYASVNTTADAIMSARFFDCGLYSGSFSVDYRPAVNLKFEVASAANRSDYLFWQSVYYGAYARKPTVDQIPADPKHAYGTFDDAMARKADYIESLRTGTRAIAVLIAQLLRTNGI